MKKKNKNIYYELVCDFNYERKITQKWNTIIGGKYFGWNKNNNIPNLIHAAKTTTSVTYGLHINDVYPGI